MDKSRADKLKEILNQTLSSEEIEKKLKEEVKQTTTKKTSKENSEEYKKEESPLNKKVKIPNIRDKKRENININIILYLTMIIVILLLSIVIYLFLKEPKEQKNQATIKKEKIIEEEKTIKEKFESPDEETQDKIEINNLEKKLIENEGIGKETKHKPKIQIKEIIKEKVVTKVTKLDKKNFKEYYNSTKYNTLKCYNFEAGNIFPDKECTNSLEKFLTTNKNAIRFEVIPVIADVDYTIFKNLDENIKNLDKNYQERIKEYMLRGLSRERVLETSWRIKDVLGKDTILTPTNYYVKSKKDNKGVIIKAYH